MEEHGRALEGVREAIVHLELRMDARFEAIDRRFEAIDRRFEALEANLEARFQHLEARFGRLEARLDASDEKWAGEIASLGRRVDRLDERLSRQFVWLVGSQMTMLLAIVAALTTAFFAR